MRHTPVKALHIALGGSECALCYFLPVLCVVEFDCSLELLIFFSCPLDPLLDCLGTTTHEGEESSTPPQLILKATGC